MTPWTAAYQAPPSMGFSRQEYWSGVPLPSPLFQLASPKLVTLPCRALLTEIPVKAMAPTLLCSCPLLTMLVFPHVVMSGMSPVYWTSEYSTLCFPDLLLCLLLWPHLNDHHSEHRTTYDKWLATGSCC